MVFLFRKWSQVGGCAREIHYSHISLFCAWNASPFFWGRWFGRTVHPIGFRGQIRISHLFFADNIFLFTKAKLMVYQSLREVFYRNFVIVRAKLLVPTNLVYGFHPTMTQIGTYIRTPSFTTRRTANTYQYLVDKIRKRIEGWQAKYLSMAGHVTLINFLAASIPIYAMQTTLLP